MSDIVKRVGAFFLMRISWLSLDYGSELLNVAFLKVVLN